MSTFTALGNVKDGHDESLRVNDRVWWTISRHARPGDRVFFYLKAPISGFVATGTVRSQPTLITSGKWKGHHRADIDVNRSIEPEVGRHTILTRFPTWGWMKTPIQSSHVPPEIEADLLTLLEGPNRPTEADTVTPSPKYGGWQIDPEQRKRVEKSAVAFVQRRLRADGWKAVSCESEKCGYDLRCTQRRQELHVEVKGTTSSELEFQITRRERDMAGTDKFWELWIVTNALSSKPRHQVVPGKELEHRFTFTPTQYMARPK
ncbi:MAG: DUF3883 domain-containing protein [Tepidisphaeraceae bacterium]